MQQEIGNHLVVFLGAHGQGKSTVAGLIVKELIYVSPYAFERIDEHPLVQENPNLRYAFLIDRLRTERQKKETQLFSTFHITISEKAYTLINIPGDFQYINQIQIGIAYGDIAVFVLSGVKEKYQQDFKEQSSLELQLRLWIALGKKHIICAINDMDLVEYQQDCYEYVVNDFSSRLAKFEINPKSISFVPISLIDAENIKTKKQHMNWYKGPTLIEALDWIPIDDIQVLANRPLRFVMHDCIFIPGVGTVALGKLLYGTLMPNKVLSFAPVPLKSSVKALENHHFILKKGFPGYLIGVHLTNLSYREIKNGYVFSDIDNDPALECTTFVVKLKIMEDFKHQLKPKQYYTIHFLTKRMQCGIVQISQKTSLNDQNQNIENPQDLKAGDVGVVEFKPIKQITLENHIDYPQLGRIAIVDNRRMIAYGVILEVKKKEINQKLEQEVQKQ
ncbi:unnamed protein product [Paramecium octaurelia]|uniref:Uncharacterized protein n=1 Tax=Paramecium octaurelia TaxID=43137 RepID=A0A8S1X078_PAROT|nr:unnamed protein product [Paramecium octaurelia]